MRVTTLRSGQDHDRGQVAPVEIQPQAVLIVLSKFENIILKNIRTVGIEIRYLLGLI